MTNPTLLDQFAGDPSLRVVQESSSWKAAVATSLLMACLAALTFAQPEAPATPVAQVPAATHLALDAPAPAPPAAP
jgi:hypothetical protein